MAMPCTLTGGPPSKVSAIGKDCPLDNDQLSWAKPRLQLGAPSIMTRKIMPLWYAAVAPQCENSPVWSLVKAPPCQLPTLIEPYGPRASAERTATSTRN